MRCSTESVSAEQPGWSISRSLKGRRLRTSRFDHTEPRHRLAHHRPLELCSQPQPTRALTFSSQRNPLHRPLPLQLHNLLNPFLVLPLEARILPQFGFTQDLSAARDRGREREERAADRELEAIERGEREAAVALQREVYRGVSNANGSTYTLVSPTSESTARHKEHE